MTVQEFNEFVTQNLVCILGVFMIGALILSWLLDRTEKKHREEWENEEKRENER